MKQILEALASITDLSPILALRSLFAWEGEYMPGSGEMCVVTDPQNESIRLLYLPGQEMYSLKATNAGEDIVIDAGAGIATEKNLCNVIGAWGLTAIPKNDGFTFIGKSNRSQRAGIEELWDRLLQIDQVWCNLHRQREYLASESDVLDSLIKIYVMAGEWSRLRMRAFENGESGNDFDSQMLINKIRDLDTWAMPALTSVEVEGDIRGNAFTFYFNEGRYSMFMPLDLDWKIEKPFNPERYAAAQKKTFEKYDVRPTVVTDDVRAVLSNVEVSGQDVRITQQLNKKLYAKVNEALTAIGGRWHTGRQAHVFEDDPKELLEEVVLAGAVYTRRDYEFFWTSSELAERAVVAAELEPGMLVLEPSAGDGALAAKAAKVVGIESVRCFELMPRNVKILRNKGFTVDGPTDFLKTQPQEIADRIIMNPPFSGGRDAAHIQHAMKWLKPGGLLVAIASTQWQIHDTRAAADFRDYLAKLGAWIEQIEAGAFKEAGTDLETTLIVVRKPVEEPISSHVANAPATEQGRRKEEALQVEMF
jgi:predicted RNA methylase